MPPDAIKPLVLNAWDGGTPVPALVGQEIEITLGTVGLGQYEETAHISSPAVVFLSATFPPGQNPGGPTQLFRFKAVQPGIATITIEHTTENHDPFRVTIEVQ